MKTAELRVRGKRQGLLETSYIVTSACGFQWSNFLSFIFSLNPPTHISFSERGFLPIPKEVSAR
jgi:hypothetical protein